MFQALFEDFPASFAARSVETNPPTSVRALLIATCGAHRGIIFLHLSTASDGRIKGGWLVSFSATQNLARVWSELGYFDRIWRESTKFGPCFGQCWPRHDQISAISIAQQVGMSPKDAKPKWFRVARLPCHAMPVQSAGAEGMHTTTVLCSSQFVVVFEDR